MGFDFPKRCIDCRKARRDAKKAAEAKENARQKAIEQEEREKKWKGDEKKLEYIFKEIPFYQTRIKNMNLVNPSKTLVVIGNGFDIMHGVKSSYWDFQKMVSQDVNGRE